MKLANAIEGGIAGISTLSLIQEAIGKIDGRVVPDGLLQHPKLLAKIKKQSKKGKYPAKLYLKLASELLSGAAYFGLTAVGKKKNAVLRGAILGAVAGLGSVVFNFDKDESELNREEILKALLTIALYTSGGLIAGVAIKKMAKNKKRKK